MAQQPRGKNRKIQERQLALRAKLWPGLNENLLWHRKKRDGFTTIPRTLPLIGSIMDDMSKGKPLFATYMELWCRVFDESFVTLSKHREMAYHSGFRGQRAERTWTDRMKILDELGFIGIKPGQSGPLSYALIFNPYVVIKRHFEEKHPGVPEAAFNALIARAIEIGASDLDEPEPEPSPPTDLDDEIPF